MCCIVVSNTFYGLGHGREWRNIAGMLERDIRGGVAPRTLLARWSGHGEGIMPDTAESVLAERLGALRSIGLGTDHTSIADVDSGAVN